MLRRPLHAGAAVLAMAAVLAPGSTAPAQEAERPSINLYGVPGVIDMPGAIVQPDGQMTVSYSAFGNTTRRNFTFQILPRVSGTLRYATINAWGKPNDPDYDLFDRSFDLQLQILNEQPGWQPSLTLGFRDFLGTGVYSAEYLVASKTVWRDFTLTGGVGWGRLRRGRTRSRIRSAPSPTRCASATTTSARAGRSPGTASSAARTWASSAASSGARRSTS